MRNPFCLQEVPVDAPFCDRSVELRELRSFAEAKTNVVLYSPGRFGKTSLVRRVQKALSDDGAIAIFSDFFGVASAEDVAARLAKAVFAATHKQESTCRRALQAMRAFHPVLRTDLEGGIYLSVEPTSPRAEGIAILRETIASIGEFVRETDTLVHVVLDEFQEIALLREKSQIEAILKTEIDRQEASYFFVGSRRRILLAMFDEEQRPFFRSAIGYPLKALPEHELETFLRARFQAGGKHCGEDHARHIAAKTSYHPYYTQKLAFLVFECSDIVSEDSIAAAYRRLIAFEQPVFEAILQGLSPHQKLLLRTLAMEPSVKPLTSAYIRKHRLGSTGGVQHSLRHLSQMDLVEKIDRWKVVDPLFSRWLLAQLEEKL